MTDFESEPRRIRAKMTFQEALGDFIEAQLEDQCFEYDEINVKKVFPTGTDAGKDVEVDYEKAAIWVEIELTE